MPKILDGKWLASKIQDRIRQDVDSNVRAGKRAPGLGVILVGDNPASKVYVANKSKAAQNCGFVTKDINLSSSADFTQVKQAILAFNQDRDIDGILLQLPLPHGLDAHAALELIDPLKDCDGLHPTNQGLLMAGRAKVFPCTPLGSMKLLDLALDQDPPADPKLHVEFVNRLPKSDLAGKTAVIVGRSILVGKPISLMLLERNATVTIAHSKTQNLAKICAQADIVIGAVGVAKLIKADWVKAGAIVIDVGINRNEAGKLCGDVDFEAVKNKCMAITPVPGGVGPMTISMLLQNTFTLNTLRYA